MSTLSLASTSSVDIWDPVIPTHLCALLTPTRPLGWHAFVSAIEPIFKPGVRQVQSRKWAIMLVPCILLAQGDATGAPYVHMRILSCARLRRGDGQSRVHIHLPFDHYDHPSSSGRTYPSGNALAMTVRRLFHVVNESDVICSYSFGCPINEG